jgi:hypothetical protein
MGTFFFVIFILGTIGWFAWLASAHQKHREARERGRYRRRMECQRVLPALCRYVGAQLANAASNGDLDDLLDLCR